jgi:hydrogenase expression/formation protein HypD
MRFIEEFRDAAASQKIARMIRQSAAGRRVKIMEVCGTHTAAIHKFGIRALVGDSVDLISGPGCPVCVTPDDYLRNAISLLRDPRVILATYGDMVRVPVDGTSLEKERARQGRVVSVPSAFAALEIALRQPQMRVIFLAVGFETTAPATALVLEQAKRQRIKNFLVYSAHKTIPQALALLGADRDLKIQGFLLPGHVSVIIGQQAYQKVLRPLGVPAVISGFEPLDILVSLFRLVQAAVQGRFIFENEYRRVVTKRGNPRAQRILKKIFTPCDGLWRGLGTIADSEYEIRSPYAAWDAAKEYQLKMTGLGKKNKTGCRCGDVLKGKITPAQCVFFVRKCRPDTPQGPCMVSAEGTCRAYFETRGAVKG